MDQDGNPFSNDDGDLVEEDPEAAKEIEYTQTLRELDDMSDEEPVAIVALTAEIEPEDYDEIDFDEEGNTFALSGSKDQELADAFAGAGVGKGKRIRPAQMRYQLRSKRIF